MASNKETRIPIQMSVTNWQGQPVKDSATGVDLSLGMACVEALITTYSHEVINWDDKQFRVKLARRIQKELDSKAPFYALSKPEMSTVKHCLAYRWETVLAESIGSLLETNMEVQGVN